MPPETDQPLPSAARRTWLTAVALWPAAGLCGAGAVAAQAEAASPTGASAAVATEPEPEPPCRLPEGRGNDDGNGNGNDDGDLRLIGSPFPIMQHLARRAETCRSDHRQVRFKLSDRAENEIDIAFASDSPCPFDAAQVSSAFFGRLWAYGRLRSMSDIERHWIEAHEGRAPFEPAMRITVDGQLLAVAFQSNAQVLFYRADLLERYGVAVPRTHEDLLAAAMRLRAADPALRYPLAHTFAAGFDVAVEFVNWFLSAGGRFFEPGSARPAFADAIGVQTVERLRAMLPLMTPNALAANTDDVMNQFQQGRAALGVLWMSRAQRMDDPRASQVVGKMRVAPAPSALPGGPTASTLWWDGFVLPRRARRPASQPFAVLAATLDAAAVRSGNDLGRWLRGGYQPPRTGDGVGMAIAAGAPMFPIEPYFELARVALGTWLPRALTGAAPAAQALADAARDYLRAARERQFV